MLEADGHTVCGVVGGAETLRAAHRWRPDAILVDWQMPDMDGMTAIRALRGDSRTASIPILMMSAADDGRQAAVRAGADGFLRKPFGAEELNAGIDELVARGPRPGGRFESQKCPLLRRAFSLAHRPCPVGGQVNDGERERVRVRRRS